MYFQGTHSIFLSLNVNVKMIFYNCFLFLSVNSKHFLFISAQELLLFDFLQAQEDFPPQAFLLQSLHKVVLIFLDFPKSESIECLSSRTVGTSYTSMLENWQAMILSVISFSRELRANLGLSVRDLSAEDGEEPLISEPPSDLLE